MPPRLLRQLILLQGLGFSLVVALIWADELLDLPHMLLGAAPTPLRTSEALLESSAVIGLGLLTVALTLRLIRRVHYLESFIVLCAWCRRVREGIDWVPIETFLAARQASTSHGLCPACERRLEEGSTGPAS